MQRQLFRKAALERLSTPEKLDQLITVLDKKAWISLFTLLLMITTLVAWGVWGSIKTRVEATGILLGGEVHNIVAVSQGEITELLLKSGDKVAKDQIVARIAQPNLLRQIEETKVQLKELQESHQNLLSFENKEANISIELSEQQRKNTKQSIEMLEKNLAITQKQVAMEEDLLAKGLITRPQVQATQQQGENIKQQIEGLKLDLIQLSKQSLDANYSISQQTQRSEQRMASTERLLKQLKDQYDSQTAIISPYEGEVLELLVDRGDIVGLGSALVKITKKTSEEELLTGLMFIPAKDGKKLTAGMDILVSPVTVLPEEFGYIRGDITYVSEYPATAKGIQRVLKNEQLVAQMMQLGAPIEIYVTFKKNPETISKYFWTSGEGPALQVQAGTPCTARITTETQNPISLVIPAFKRFFQLY